MKAYKHQRKFVVKLMPRKLIPKTRCNNTWSESQYSSFIKSALRRASTRWKPKYDTKKQARLKQKKMGAKGRMVFFSKCNACKKSYPETTCSVDHIIPIIDPATGFTTWDDVIEKLFCDSNNLQVLCKTCHDKKTAKEKKVATERRKLNKLDK